MVCPGRPGRWKSSRTPQARPYRRGRRVRAVGVGAGVGVFARRNDRRDDETRHALWQREAELAAGVPFVPHEEEEKHLAARLDAVLRGGTEAVDCQAAALYLLDDATSQLKMRSCWGLPLDRLAAPARPLKGAVADLEALLGHAVVVEDTDVLRHWNVPEEFPAAVCVPVATSTTLLGTLWIFSAAAAGFTRGRRTCWRSSPGGWPPSWSGKSSFATPSPAAEVKQQLHAAERLQSNQLPTISPLLDGWQLAGWTAQADGLGGDFHDWFCLPNGLLAIAAGHAMKRGVEAALAAGGMKAALRAHGQYCREAQQTLKRLNLTTWTGSAGDQYGSLFFGLIRNLERSNLLCLGGPAQRAADSPGRLGVAQPGFAAVGRESGIGLRAIRLGIAARRGFGDLYGGGSRRRGFQRRRLWRGGGRPGDVRPGRSFR